MTPKRAALPAAALLTSLALLAPAPLAPAQAFVVAAQPESPRELARVPILLRNNHILVRAVVNDSDSLWFIVDSGASGNVLNRSTALRLGFTVVPGVQAHGAGGPAQGGTVDGAVIRLPGMTMDDTRLVALDLDPLALKTGHPCDGIIGVPFWNRAVVQVDYARSEMTLFDAKAYRYRGDGAVLPLTFEHGLPYVKARATIRGGKPAEGRFVIDTGSSLALILAPAFAARHQALSSVPRTLRVQLGGVGGPSMSPLGRIERLEIGPYALEAPLTIFRQAGRGETSANDTAGNIGGDILRRFTVTFDYGRRRMILEPAAAYREPFEADMSGLVFSVRDDGSNAVEVIVVQEDSPAADLGIRVGDVLETFDGRAVVTSALVDLRRDLRQEGRTVRLGLRRDDLVTERTLVTRRLL